MIYQKKGSRALWAVAFAAAPIGALATPVNTPASTCDSAGDVSRIGWQDGYYFGSKDTVLGATVYQGSESETKADLVQFVCGATNSGWDLTKTEELAARSDIETGASSVPSVFGTADISQGSSFLIDFGTPQGGPTTKDPIGLFTQLSAYDYTTSMPGLGDPKAGGQVWVTDLNLDFNATDLLTGQVLYQDYLGVQVISGASALDSKFFFNSGNGHYVLDPPISGVTKVNLLSSPDPHSIPEPAGWTLMAAGLLGLAEVARRRRKESSGGGEPEA
jgi:hypothetical protein